MISQQQNEIHTLPITLVLPQSMAHSSTLLMDRTCILTTLLQFLPNLHGQLCNVSVYGDEWSDYFDIGFHGNGDQISLCFETMSFIASTDLSYKFYEWQRQPGNAIMLFTATFSCLMDDIMWAAFAKRFVYYNSKILHVDKNTIVFGIKEKYACINVGSRKVILQKYDTGEYVLVIDNMSIPITTSRAIVLKEKVFDDLRNRKTKIESLMVEWEEERKDIMKKMDDILP